LKKKIDPADKKGKELKKWAKKFKLLFISESLVRQLPKLGGPFLTKWGKFPTVIQTNDDVKAKIEEGLQTVKFQLKKVLCLGVAVANASMTEEQIRQNLNMSINYLVSLLKKGWNNIKSLYVRTTMGHPVKLF
jgi:large subunit ribosomal protein L10Ae